MPRKPESTKIKQPKTLALGIHAPYNRTQSIDAYYQEFLNLIKTDGIEYDQSSFIRLRHIESSTFLTKGKLQDVAKICTEHNIERVIISEPLTALQERNLKDMLDAKIIDRTRLILEIFQKAAKSAEGKLQVEIALLKHVKSRLAGKGIGMSQQAGFIGGRGPGERAKEIERRHLEEYILKTRRQLEKIGKTRAIQRKRRLESQVPHICLIGYTNAGKSTILNALTKADVLAEDKPFATLDTTTKALFVNGKKKGVISDTVGFIQNLPHMLIDAFKATLNELQYADLLLHVVDISDPNWKSQIKIVHEILNELGVDKQMLYVFNKADQVDDLEALHPELQKYQPHVITCATSKLTLQPLLDFLRTWQK